MDRKNSRLIVIVALILLFPTAVAADTGEPVALPVPLPAMPADVQPLTFPSLVLPVINSANWPSAIAGIEAISARIASTMNTVESMQQREFSRVNEQIAAVRAPISRMQSLIGSPQTDVTAQSDTTQYNSLYSMATASTAAIQTSVAYLRGLSGIGATGLNLTFVFIGLGWITIVNLLDLALFIPWSLEKFIIRAIEWIMKIVDLILQVIQALGGFVPGT
ncbi:MAG: hypothetical protein K8R89_00795 [Anaerolineae bacterium]|nr:hypothetical protein [Anaerolineae bacterium]